MSAFSVSRPLRILATLFCLAVPAFANAQAILDIGDQRGNARAVLEASGQLKDVPYIIHWHEFPNAAPLLEAMSADKLDAGTVGDAPLTYAGSRSGFNIRGIFATQYLGNAVIVGQNVKAGSIKDLVGKHIATVNGSSGNAMALEALQSAGLPLDAIHFTNLAPGDASTALAGGSIDGIATWEPYVSFAVLKSGARIIADGKDFPSLSYFVATTQAISTKRAALADLVKRLAAARIWSSTHRIEYAKVISHIVGIPEDVALGQITREVNAPSAITPQIVAQQQRTIDLYLAAGLIKSRVDAHTLLDSSFGNPVPGAK